MDASINKGVNLIEEAEKILVFTGAGLSTESGTNMTLRTFTFRSSSLTKRRGRSTG
jgi:NAD-dependent SIR2 family protein deacetylase